MHDLSVDKGRTSETSRTFTAIKDPAVEMGTPYDGFHLGLTHYQQGDQCDMGYS